MRPFYTPFLIATLASASLLTACTSSSENTCTDESDCFENEVCVNSMCARTQEQPDTGTDVEERPDTEDPDAAEEDAGDADDTGADAPDGGDGGSEEDAGPDADLSPCEPNPCTEPGRTSCTVEDDTALCSCDEGLADNDGACVQFTCESAGLGPVIELSGGEGKRQDVEASIVWADDTYLSAYSDDRASSNGNPSIYVSRHDASGARLGTERRITTT